MIGKHRMNWIDEYRKLKNNQNEIEKSIDRYFSIFLEDKISNISSINKNITKNKSDNKLLPISKSDIVVKPSKPPKIPSSNIKSVIVDLNDLKLKYIEDEEEIKYQLNKQINSVKQVMVEFKNFNKDCYDKDQIEYYQLAIFNTLNDLKTNIYKKIEILENESVYINIIN